MMPLAALEDCAVPVEGLFAARVQEDVVVLKYFKFASLTVAKSGF
jgi:hypothetical protein